MTRILRPVRKRATITIPDELDTILREEAERQGVSISELTRAALRDYLGLIAPGERRHVLSAGTAI